MTIDYNPENCVISVGVSDYDRSLAWYRDVLGFELVYELKEYGWCELKTPFGFNIGLGQTETVDAGQRHADVRRARHRRARSPICAAHDVKVEDWHEIPDMVRLSTFYDPDGTPWMLAQTARRLVDRADRGESRHRGSRPVRSTTPPRPAAGRRPKRTTATERGSKVPLSIHTRAQFVRVSATGLV